MSYFVKKRHAIVVLLFVAVVAAVVGDVVAVTITSTVHPEWLPWQGCNPQFILRLWMNVLQLDVNVQVNDVHVALRFCLM